MTSGGRSFVFVSPFISLYRFHISSSLCSETYLLHLTSRVAKQQPAVSLKFPLSGRQLLIFFLFFL